MAFTLPPLPYSLDALAPHLSRETLELHHGKHHQTYVDKLNGLVGDDGRTNDSLDEVILAADGGPLFKNAAQHWNHSFYWQGMAPGGGGHPSGELAEAIDRAEINLRAAVPIATTVYIEPDIRRKPSE